MLTFTCAGLEVRKKTKVDYVARKKRHEFFAALVQTRKKTVALTRLAPAFCCKEEACERYTGFTGGVVIHSVGFSKHLRATHKHPGITHAD